MFVSKSGNKNANDHNFSAGGGGGGVTVCNVMGNRSGRMLTAANLQLFAHSPNGRIITTARRNTTVLCYSVIRHPEHLVRLG